MRDLLTRVSAACLPSWRLLALLFRRAPWMSVATLTGVALTIASAVATILLVGALLDAAASRPSAVAPIAWSIAVTLGTATVGTTLTDFFARRLQDSLHAWFADLILDARLAGEHRGMTELDTTRDGYTQTGIQSIAELLVGIGVAASAAVLVTSWNWVAALVLVPVWLVFGAQMSLWLASTYESQGKAAVAEQRAEYLRELLTGRDAASEIRLFRAQRWLLAQFATQLSLRASLMSTVRRPLFRRVQLLVCVLVIVHAGVFAMLGWSTWTGRTNVAEFSVVVQALLALAGLATVGDATASAAKLVATVDGVAAMAPARDRAPSDPAPLAPPAGTMWSFEGAGFGYSDGRPLALSSVDLQIDVGECVAVVGANGAGKSTLLAMMAGELRPTTGRLRVADHDVRWMSQKTIRYPLTAEDNVALGRDAHDPAMRGIRSRRALADARLADLPLDELLAEGYEGGTGLSGGQWQRIGLARALYATDDAAGGALLLDEPASALDVHAEKQLFDDLMAAKTLTRVFVSHRLSGMVNAPRIIVMDAGRIVGDGTHSELIQSCAPYREMWQAQHRRLHETDR